MLMDGQVAAIGVKAEDDGLPFFELLAASPLLQGGAHPVCKEEDAGAEFGHALVGGVARDKAHAGIVPRAPLLFVIVAGVEGAVRAVKDEGGLRRKAGEVLVPSMVPKCGDQIVRRLQDLVCLGRVGGFHVFSTCP